MKKMLAGAFVAVWFVVSAGPWTMAGADDDKNKGNGKLRADPFVFVGKAGDCGAGYPAGSRIVTSAWLGGMGLPDNGGLNTSAADLATNPNKNDPHKGLLLSKNGPTPDCSAAGAQIKGVKGMTVTATSQLGLDFRNGGHCGAGAPRFNVDTDMGFFFVGCANAPQVPAPQDLLQWTQTRSVLTTCGVECFPGPIPAGAKIKSIDLIFDEGTDTANNDTQGVGLAVVDNIFFNGQVITSNTGDDGGD
jgi:hypothetical protein